MPAPNEKKQLAASEKKKPSVLNVLLPDRGFARKMFFNRFRVEKQEGFAVVFLGLVSDSGLVDEFCFVMSNDALTDNKETLLPYLDRIGHPKSEVPKWITARGDAPTTVVDILHMTHTGEFSEIQLIGFSKVSAYRLGQEMAKQEKAVNVMLEGDAICVLRSSTEVQRCFLKALYE